MWALMASLWVGDSVEKMVYSMVVLTEHQMAYGEVVEKVEKKVQQRVALTAS